MAAGARAFDSSFQLIKRRYMDAANLSRSAVRHQKPRHYDPRYKPSAEPPTCVNRLQ
jgi:hypothetical protein